MSSSKKIQGIARVPIIDPNEALKAINKMFPNIPNWYIQFAEVASTMLDVNDYTKIGHDEPQDCQLKIMGHGEACGRDADFILVNVMLAETPSGVEAYNSRVRYYCAPCVYTTMNRALQSIYSADKLEDGDAWDGIEERCGIVLEQRVGFVEEMIGRSAEVVENKYASDGDAIIEELRKKFDGT